MTSLPEALFQADGGVRNVVEGSVIQLFCSVKSTAATFFWTKDGTAVVIDVPHLRERTTIIDITTISMLTVDNFQSTDDGLYQCIVQTDLEIVGMGETANLTGASTIASAWPITPLHYCNHSRVLGCIFLEAKCLNVSFWIHSQMRVSKLSPANFECTVGSLCQILSGTCKILSCLM